MYHDNPLMYAEDLLEQALFNGSSLGWEIAGSHQTMTEMKRAEVIEFYRRNYVPERMVIAAAGKVDGRKTIELTSSRDLRHWNRVANRTPFMELSPVGDGSAYDTGQLEPANRPVVRNNELWFYYTGLRNRGMTIADYLARKHLDSGAICLAKLRLDGFVSLKGGTEWGRLLTKPLLVEGPQLRVNVDSWRGQVRAEIVDAADGHPIPGFTTDESVPVVSDNIDVLMRWKDKPDLSELLGRTVRIRFSLFQAELYAFWFTG